jgi:hypothetical protein
MSAIEVYSGLNTHFTRAVHMRHTSAVAGCGILEALVLECVVDMNGGILAVVPYRDRNSFSNASPTLTTLSILPPGGRCRISTFVIFSWACHLPPGEKLTSKRQDPVHKDHARLSR